MKKFTDLQNEALDQLLAAEEEANSWRANAGGLTMAGVDRLWLIEEIRKEVLEASTSRELELLMYSGDTEYIFS